MANGKFEGTVNLDIRDSVADWTPYEQPTPPEGAPNVLFIMWDDTGFASWESYGGLVKVPNMDRIIDKGLRYTQFHTTALCSPTRASTLTGRNHTTVSMAGISETASGFPGSNGVIPFNAATIGEVLQEKGWNTYALVKWNLTPPDELSMSASKRTCPTNRGFDR
jgi:arylsulfatase A-like enzyme